MTKSNTIIPKSGTVLQLTAVNFMKSKDMKTRLNGHTCVSLLKEPISLSVHLDCKHHQILVWAKVTPTTNGKTKVRMQSSLLQKRCA